MVHGTTLPIGGLGFSHEAPHVGISAPATATRCVVDKCPGCCGRVRTASLDVLLQRLQVELAQRSQDQVAQAEREQHGTTHSPPNGQRVGEVSNPGPNVGGPTHRFREEDVRGCWQQGVLTRGEGLTAAALALVGDWIYNHTLRDPGRRVRTVMLVKRARVRIREVKGELRTLRLRQRLMRPARLDELTLRAQMDRVQRTTDEAEQSLEHLAAHERRNLNHNPPNGQRIGEASNPGPSPAHRPDRPCPRQTRGSWSRLLGLCLAGLTVSWSTQPLSVFDPTGKRGGWAGREPLCDAVAKRRQHGPARLRQRHIPARNMGSAPGAALRCPCYARIAHS